MDLRGMKQADLVRSTGLNRGTISRYLSGEVEPRQKAAIALAKALDVSELWLWGYDVPAGRTDAQKKNDELVQVVAKLRKDPEFFEVVKSLASLSISDYESIKQLVTTLASK